MRILKIATPSFLRQKSIKIIAMYIITEPLLLAILSRLYTDMYDSHTLSTHQDIKVSI